MTDTRAPNYKALKKEYEKCNDQIKSFYSDAIKLIDNDMSYQICIAYCFLRVEQAANRILYGGVVKLHRGNIEIAKRIVNIHHLTRSGFLDLYKNIFGRPVDKLITSKIEYAEKIRDRVIHGKDVTDKEIREALVDIFEYSQSIDQEVFQVAGFHPFGDMRGFKGRGEPLDNRTTKWLMKGLGFGAR